MMRLFQNSECFERAAVAIKVRGCPEG